MGKIFEKGAWLLEYECNDGARLSRLNYHKFELLTTIPDQFKQPAIQYGKYETRPVYGYDDCFPSVEVCKYPDLKWIIPDHGELCWLEWNAEIQSDKIIFSVESKILPILFKRTLHFQEKKLIWHFEVKNNGDHTLPFQHVIHPLVKLTDIKDLKFPQFTLLKNEANGNVDINTPERLRDYLLSREEGETHMLYLQDPMDNYVEWTYKNDLKVKMNFPLEEFSTIGVWWNYRGYPDENGCRRDECAFEPIPGVSSKLDEAYSEGRSQLVESGKTKSWDIVWTLEYVN